MKTAITTVMISAAFFAVGAQAADAPTATTRA